MKVTYPPLLQRKVRLLQAVCVVLWLAATLFPTVVARAQISIGSWPLDYWWAAQGCVLMYLVIVVSYSWLLNRWESQVEQKDHQ